MMIKINKFLRDNAGANLVEYIILVGVIALIAAERSPGTVRSVLAYEAPSPWTSWWPQPASAPAEDPADEDDGAAHEPGLVDLLGDVGCRYLVQINTGITDTATGAARQAEAAAVNDQLAQLAELNDGVEVLDWNRTIAVNGGNPAITYDTVHLSEKGVVLMADAYRQALDDC